LRLDDDDRDQRKDDEQTDQFDIHRRGRRETQRSGAAG
jgi:hypothetical protein